MVMDILKKAIECQKTISFEYKNSKERVGNPHALFHFVDKKNNKSIKLDLEQIEGYSSSKKDFPSFREFNLESISEVKILSDIDSFSVSKDYNGKSERYNKAIIKL